MKRPESVVFVEPGLHGLRKETSWILSYLRRFSTVTLVHDSPPLRLALREGTQTVVVICEITPEPLLSLMTESGPKTRPVVVAHSRPVPTLGPRPGGTRTVLAIEPERIEQLFPRYACAARAEALIVACWAAMRSIDDGLDAADPLRAGLLRLFTDRSLPPLVSVDAMAASCGRSHRWLDDRWSRLLAGGEAHPSLSRIVRAVLFLRCLNLWLAGDSLRQCAARLGVGEARLRECFKEFAGATPTLVDIAKMPGRLEELQRDVFGWLIR